MDRPRTELRNQAMPSMRYIKDISLLLLSAIFLVLSYPSFNLEFCAWFAFVPLFFALQNKSKGKAFLFSYLAGIVFWFGIIYWLIHVTLIGLILLVAYLALYFGIFGLIISSTRSHVHTFTRLLFIPSVWVLLEYLRSYLFTGFGWAFLGYSQYLNLPIIQIANITGVWGVSFLVMMVNVLIYSVMRYALCAMRKKEKKSLFFNYCLLPLLLLFLSLGYGFYKLRTTHDARRGRTLKISVIQPNIPQSIKWQESAKDEIWSQYLSLSRKALKDKPDLIIWPEAALPGTLQKDPYLKNNLKALVRDIRIPLLLGAVSLDGDNYYNRAILISKQGEFSQHYDKLRLVPFGEYIPLKRILPFLETIVPIGDFSAGKEYTVFAFNAKRIAQSAQRFSVLICFEDIFPQLSRRFVKEGAEFLINITNDAWFGNTSSPYQHLSASVFRAVENGVYLVRAANTGISAFITPEGRVCSLADNAGERQTFISGYMTKGIFPILKQNSLYSQWGDWLILLCGMIVMCNFRKLKVKS